jgi:hypothetical protein
VKESGVLKSDRSAEHDFRDRDADFCGGEVVEVFSLWTFSGSRALHFMGGGLSGCLTLLSRGFVATALGYPYFARHLLTPG